MHRRGFKRRRVHVFICISVKYFSNRLNVNIKKEKKREKKVVKTRTCQQTAYHRNNNNVLLLLPTFMKAAAVLYREFLKSVKNRTLITTSRERTYQQEYAMSLSSTSNLSLS